MRWWSFFFIFVIPVYIFTPVFVNAEESSEPTSSPQPQCNDYFDPLSLYKARLQELRTELERVRAKDFVLSDEEYDFFVRNGYWVYRRDKVLEIYCNKVRGLISFLKMEIAVRELPAEERVKVLEKKRGMVGCCLNTGCWNCPYTENMRWIYEHLSQYYVEGKSIPPRPIYISSTKLKEPIPATLKFFHIALELDAKLPYLKDLL